MSELRRYAVLAVVHAALFGAIGLAAANVYAVVFCRSTLEPAWVAIDIGLVALGLGVVYRFRDDKLGFTSLGASRAAKLATIAVVAIACVLFTQRMIKDLDGRWLDESQYLLTIREHAIIVDGIYPFNGRWLEPFLAGRWNVLPIDDADALKALNFASLSVTGVALVLFLVRLRVRLAIAITAPVFLLCAQLGIYASMNRLVIDPANYALFALLLHTLVRRDHAPLFGLLLLVTAFNTEKVVYWMPVFALVELLRGEPWKSVVRRSLMVVGPTVVYFGLLVLVVLEPSRVSSLTCIENLHVMAFSWLQVPLPESVAANNFQMLWFPFGAFTLYALLGFIHAPRWLKPVALLLIPIALSALLACDIYRMIAYAFIVYLPFGFLYLSRAIADLPRWLAWLLFVLSVGNAIAMHYLYPILKLMHVAGKIELDSAKLVLSSFELAIAGAIVFVHHTFPAQKRSR